MPDMSGIRATQLPKSRHPDIAVLLVSLDEALDATLLESCGAAAFVPKRQLSPAVVRDVWCNQTG